MTPRAAQSIRRGRDMARSLMDDTCDVVRSGPSSLNTSTGLISSTTSTIVSGSPCRVRIPTTAEMTAVFGEEQVTIGRYLVAVPHDVADEVAVDDVVVVTCSSTVEGRRFRVLATPLGTHSMYRSLPCELVE